LGTRFEITALKALKQLVYLPLAGCASRRKPGMTSTSFGDFGRSQAVSIASRLLRPRRFGQLNEQVPAHETVTQCAGLVLKRFESLHAGTRSRKARARRLDKIAQALGLNTRVMDSFGIGCRMYPGEIGDNSGGLGAYMIGHDFAIG
jgi:hypothetical protein